MKKKTTSLLQRKRHIVALFTLFKTIKTTMNQQFIAKWQKQRK